MSIQMFCKNLIDQVSNSNLSVKELNYKSEGIKTFAKALSEDPVKLAQFKSNGYIKEVLQAIVLFMLRIGERSKIVDSVADSISLFFKLLTEYNISVTRQDTLDKMKEVIVHVGTVILPKGEIVQYRYWLTIFRELIHVPFFFNLFPSLRDRQMLYSIIKELAGFGNHQFSLQPDNKEYRKDALDFLSDFTHITPFIMDQKWIISFFDKMDAFMRCNLINSEFASLLDIATQMIPLAPITIMMNKNMDGAPFLPKIIDEIYIRWPHFSKIPKLWISARAYMIMYLTVCDAAGRKISNDLISKFRYRLMDCWDKLASREQTLKDAAQAIGYLRFDVEIMKRAEPDPDAPVPLGLRRMFMNGHQIKANTDVVFLFTAIARYDPSILSNDDWRLALKAGISTKNENLLTTKPIPNLFMFLRHCVPIVDDYKIWNELFRTHIVYLSRSSEDLGVQYFRYLLEVIKNQRISTKVAHEFQNKIWDCEPTPEMFFRERLACIHAMIFYYGFKDQTSRMSCLRKMNSLLGSIHSSDSKVYIKQIASILCSIIQSHAPPLIPFKDEPYPLEEICEDLMSQLTSGKKIIKENENGNNAKSGSEPIKSQHIYIQSADSSQVMSDSVPISQMDVESNSEESKKRLPEGVSLCNFVDEKDQVVMISIIQTARMQNRFDNLLFRMYLSVFAPDVFRPSTFLRDLGSIVIEDSQNRSDSSTLLDEFDVYTRLLSAVASTMDSDVFQPFFERIQEMFFEHLQIFIDSKTRQLKDHLSKFQVLSWEAVEQVNLTGIPDVIPHLSKFAARVANLAPEYTDEFINKFKPLIEQTQFFPPLNIKFIKRLIAIPTDASNFDMIVESIVESLRNVLNHFVTPIKKVEELVIEIMEALSNFIVDTVPMRSLFKELAKYNMTAGMMKAVLKMLKDHYVECSTLFDEMWPEEDDDNDSESDPFFMLCVDQSVRLATIPTIVSILKSNVINSEEHDKYSTFNDVFFPSLEGSLEEAEDKRPKYIEDAFTSLATLSSIAVEVPELSVKCIIQIIKSFCLFSPSSYPPHALRLMFSAMSERVSYCVFLQQFLKAVAKDLIKLEIDWSEFPYELFYGDMNCGLQRMKLQFFTDMAPLLIPLSIKEDNTELGAIIPRVLNMEPGDNKYTYYVSPYMLACSVSEDETEEVQQRCEELFTRMDPNIKFDSAFYFLDLLPISNKRALKQAYRYTFQKMSSSGNQYHDINFVDHRKVLFKQYANVFYANHTVIQSIELRKFSLYCSFIFTHYSLDINTYPTLFIDILRLTVNMLDFVAPSAADKLLIKISKNIPAKLKDQTKWSQSRERIYYAFEDICLAFSNISKDSFFDRFNVMIENFKESFPDIIDKIMIVPQFKDEQLSRRTFRDEFDRVAVSGKVNEEGINFMLTQLLMQKKNEPIYNSVEFSRRRNGMKVIHKFMTESNYAPSVMLYSELCVRLYEMHPSALIIDNDTLTRHDQLQKRFFDALIEALHNRDPKINGCALNVIRCAVLIGGVHTQVLEDERAYQFQEISEYNGFESDPPEKELPVTSDTPWISRVVHEFIGIISDKCQKIGKRGAYDDCTNLVLLSPQFAKRIFVHTFLEASSRNQEIFNRFMEDSKEYFDNPKEHPEECTLFIQTLCAFKNMIFDKSSPIGGRNPLAFVNWLELKIPFTKCAEMCVALGDPYSADFFAEFASEASRISVNELTTIFKKLSVKELLYDLDTEISNLDAIGDIHWQEGKINRMMMLADQNGRMDRISESLKLLHLDNLQISRGPNTEAFWRLQKWEVSSATLRDMVAGDHNTHVFKIMQSFASKNRLSVQNTLNEFFGRFEIEKESTIDEQLSTLLDASALMWFEALSYPEDSSLAKLFNHAPMTAYKRALERLVEFSSDNFGIAESSATLHSIFLSNEGFMPHDTAVIRIPNMQAQFFDELINVATSCGEVECAQFFVKILKRSLQPEIANFEQLVVLNADSPIRAVALLEKHAESLKINPNAENAPVYTNKYNLMVTLTLAKWYANTHYVPNAYIIEDLNKVVNEAHEKNEIEIECEAHFTLARFQHNIHRECLTFFNSPDYAMITDIIQKLTAELDQYNRGEPSRSMTIEIRDMTTNRNNHIENLKQEQEKFKSSIIGAIHSYMRVLALSDKHNIEALYSVINLWFNYSFAKYRNAIKDMPNLIQIMEENFPDIDPHKFIPLFYQMAARVDKRPELHGTQSSDYLDNFQMYLRSVVKAICVTEPNHCFPILFALTKNDILFNKARLTGEIVISQSKIEAVKDLIEEIRMEDPDLDDSYGQMSKLLEGYVDLAMSVRNDGFSLYQLAPDFATFNPEVYPKMAVITAKDFPTVEKFDERITILSGITKPIRITVIGTDGHRYKQILKSNRDDLRQDAVMQQLFKLMSALLERHDPSLKIRSYKVIPLTPTCGIIEFVENSIAIGEYLIIGRENVDSAYIRYMSNGKETLNKNMRTFMSCSEKLHETRNYSTPALMNMLNVFNEVSRNLKPVFRFFFVERFPNAGDWFNARMRYCRHTATNSMVGHVFGIGDRHSSNILMDNKTGEVIHIDLGVAFEQGKMLYVREIVPFRLTQNIIDGFGHQGGMGVFRRACEETLTVLRTNAEYLLTVLDVFMRDPLYNWSVTPAKQHQEHEDMRRAFNARSLAENKKKESYGTKTAENVIIRCRAKLEGKDRGEVLSIEGQVAQLISEAADPRNLMMMFHGWKPFL